LKALIECYVTFLALNRNFFLNPKGLEGNTSTRFIYAYSDESKKKRNDRRLRSVITKLHQKSLLRNGVLL